MADKTTLNEMAARMSNPADVYFLFTIWEEREALRAALAGADRERDTWQTRCYSAIERSEDLWCLIREYHRTHKQLIYDITYFPDRDWPMSYWATLHNWRNERRGRKGLEPLLWRGRSNERLSDQE